MGLGSAKNGEQTSEQSFGIEFGGGTQVEFDRSFIERRLDLEF